MFTLRLLIGTSGASGRDDMRLTYIPSAPTWSLVNFLRILYNCVSIGSYQLGKSSHIGKSVIWKKEYFEILLKKMNRYC